MQVYSVDKLMSEARRLAVEYRRATGRPLAIGGELALYDAVRLLDLEAAPAGAAGYDALGKGVLAGVRFQVKNRTIYEGKSGQRVGHIGLGQEWDRVLLVLFDAEYFPFQIHEATREQILEIYDHATESRRAKRGPLSVARFKNIARLVWSAELGLTEHGREEKPPSHVARS